MAANQAPDIIELGSTWVAGFCVDGGLKGINAEGLKSKLNNWKPALYRGKTCAVPWTVSTGALFYNKKLLARAGIKSLPANWKELQDAASKISQLDKDIFGYGIKTGAYSTWQKFLPFAWSNGGVVIKKDLLHSGVAEPAFIESIQYYKQLRKSGYFDENTAVRKAFQEGRLGFMIKEPGQIARFQKDSPELDFGIMALPPAPDTGKSINFAGGQMLAITKNAKHPKAAEKLIRFLVQGEVTRAITSRITTLFPADKAMIADDYYRTKHPELRIFLQIMETATSPEPHPRWIDIQEVFSEQLERVLYDRTTPEKAMVRAKEMIEEILEDEAITQGQ